MITCFHFLFYPFRIIPSYRRSRTSAHCTRLGLLGISLFSTTDFHPLRIPVYFLNPAFRSLSLTLVFRYLVVWYIYMYVATLYPSFELVYSCYKCNHTLTSSSLPY